MQKFIIGTDNYGVGKITWKIDREELVIRDLTIEGDKETLDKLSGDDLVNWPLFPPKFYVWEAPFEMKDGKIQVQITEEMLDDYDIALYLMEHNDVYGLLTIDETGMLFFEGVTFISGKEKQLVLEVKLPA